MCASVLIPAVIAIQIHSVFQAKIKQKYVGDYRFSAKKYDESGAVLKAVAIFIAITFLFLSITEQYFCSVL